MKYGIENNVSLSLETHISGKYFLFNRYVEYIDFVNNYPLLGILIDISHNYYDNYSEEDIYEAFKTKNVKGLHISDAIQGAEFDYGTHLSIGDGKINFKKLLKLFESMNILYGALEIKASNDKIKRSLMEIKNIIGLK